VIALPSRQRDEQRELVEFFNNLAAKAARGETTGLMYVELNSSGEREWGMCGRFTDDMGQATEAAIDGMAAFMEYKAEVEGSRELLKFAHRNHQKYDDFDYIERLLREA